MYCDACFILEGVKIHWCACVNEALLPEPRIVPRKARFPVPPLLCQLASRLVLKQIQGGRAAVP